LASIPLVALLVWHSLRSQPAWGPVEIALRSAGFLYLLVASVATIKWYAARRRFLTRLRGQGDRPLESFLELKEGQLEERELNNGQLRYGVRGLYTTIIEPAAMTRVRLQAGYLVIEMLGDAFQLTAMQHDPQLPAARARLEAMVTSGERPLG